jgi:transcriptional regulator with XRE-family HTH domain
MSITEFKELRLNYKIKKIRELKDLTVKEMATGLQITPRTYSYMETGKIKITVERLFEISLIFRCEMNDIIGFDVAKFL